MSITNGGLRMETFLYVDEQSTFDLTVADGETQIRITGRLGDDCYLILTEGVVERLSPLFLAAIEKLQSAAR